MGLWKRFILAPIAKAHAYNTHTHTHRRTNIKKMHKQRLQYNYRSIELKPKALAIVKDALNRSKEQQKKSSAIRCVPGCARTDFEDILHEVMKKLFRSIRSQSFSLDASEMINHLLRPMHSANCYIYDFRFSFVLHSAVVIPISKCIATFHMWNSRRTGYDTRIMNPSTMHLTQWKHLDSVGRLFRCCVIQWWCLWLRV